MHTAAHNVEDVAINLRSTSILAKQVPLAFSNATGARMCQVTFFV